MISLLRIVWLKNWDITDLTYTVTPGACWSVLEPTLGVVNACLPTIRPSLRKILNKDVLAWSKANRKHSNIDRAWKRNRTGPSTFPSDSDKNSFVLLKDIQTPPTDPQVSTENAAASDDLVRPDVVKLDGNATRVTRAWHDETVEDGSHHV